MSIRFKIMGLDCANCAVELEEAIKKISGVKNVSISFMSQRMEIECDENEKNEIIEKMKKVIKKEEPDVTIEEIN